MRIATVIDDQRSWLGIVDPDARTVQEVSAPTAGYTDPAIAFIESVQTGRQPPFAAEPVSLDAVRLLSPIRQPSKNIICVGKNYRAHAAEFTGSGYDSSATNPDDAVPDAPILFSKAPSCLVGAFDDVVVPWELSEEIDYEAELGVIIGRRGRNIAEAEAMDYVWGYTVINDITARDLQSRHKQWLLGKSIDTFCPMGPSIVSADELDPANLVLSCWVNGELRQQANTKDLIFDIPTIVAVASASMTLEPGDIIATGTPAGVGIGFTPPRFLKKEDVVRVSIPEIGTIENRIT
ncbi:MAG: fumarylacetoacetate hydrolase family protein [Pseudomonadota bacterium]